MAIGAPGPRTGSAYWTSGAPGLGAGAEVRRHQAPGLILAGLKVPEPQRPEEDRLEVGRAKEPEPTSYRASGLRTRSAASSLEAPRKEETLSPAERPSPKPRRVPPQLGTRLDVTA